MPAGSPAEPPRGPRPGPPPATRLALTRRQWLAAFVFYGLIAVLFTRLYVALTGPMPLLADGDWTQGGAWLFRHRILVPLAARAIVAASAAPLHLAIHTLTVLAVFGLLFAYRSYLSNFLEPRASLLLAPAIVYPLLWNYCLLNRLYLPFDLPSVLFFTLGCHLIYRRRWLVYYVVLALAMANRDTAAFLVFVFLVTQFDQVPRRRLAVHLIAQCALAGGVAYASSAAAGGRGLTQSIVPMIAVNGRTILDMLLFRGNALRDWAKLVLAFGGVWWIAPWVLRRQDRFIRRTTAVVVPFVVVAAAVAVIDEVRQYGELVPVLLTPVLIALASRAGLASRPEPPSPGEAGGGI